MKNLLMSLALVGSLAAMSAKGDSYIYWMADVSDGVGDNARIGTFQYAQLAAYNGGTKVAAFDASYADAIGWDGGTGPEGTATRDRNPSQSLVSSPDFTFADAQNWTYYVELYTDDWMKGKSTVGYSWEQLQGMDAIYQSTLAGGLGQAKFTTFTYNAPEPTSGLLVLFGLCGLALKRKRA